VKPLRANSYCGRFAPSPTGPLHLGSIVAAVGSYLQAKTNNGKWLLRIEDLDPPREVKGSADAILTCLENLGLYWDDTVLFQSQQFDAYTHALEQLVEQGSLFACRCSRKTLQLALANRPIKIYPGTCRNNQIFAWPTTPRTSQFNSHINSQINSQINSRLDSQPNAQYTPHVTSQTKNLAIRIKVDNRVIEFTDAVQGSLRQQLDTDVGDFIVRRVDGLIAYQLAVVVDDAQQNITEVVRGADLFDNTPRQIFLQQLLSLPRLNYVHLPLVVDATGTKISKQAQAASINMQMPVQCVYKALEFLGQDPPAELVNEDLDILWQWAFSHWDITKITRRQKHSIA